MNQRIYYLSAVLLIGVISLFTYYPALSNGLILNWDDGTYIKNNQHIQSLSLDNIYWMFTAFYASNWHPLTWLSHAIDYALYGSDPWGHHLTSVIFHALNSIWVFVLSIFLVYIVEKPSNEIFNFSNIFNPKRFAVALLTAILFAIHPQHVESVAWVAERKDMLFFFFFIPSLLSYVIYSQTNTKRWYVLSLVFFALSLLSKPMAVTLPIILILFDVYPLKQIELNKIDYKRWFINKIPFLIIALAAGIFTLLAQSGTGAVASLEEVNLQMRILNAFNSLVAYFEKWLLPLHLSPFYPLQHVKFQSIQGHLINVFAVLITTLIAIYFWLKSQKAWLIGWLFYIITLLPVLGLIQVGSQGMADRYAYLTTLPFYLLFAIGIVALYQKYSKLISMLLVITIYVSLVSLTHEQIKIWRNSLTFWDYVVRSDPESSLAQGLLGTVYMEMGNYEQAVKYFEHSVALSGGYSGSHGELGRAYLRVGRLEDALKAFQTALSIDNAPAKIKAEIYFNMALVHLSKEDKASARLALEQALNIVPNHSEWLRLKKDLQE
jgi:protein O-mannosyl-transferase